ncbi:prepilin-type cleavage/methylation domain-containing protein [Vibrio vulnificus]|nr:pilin [Vibrio vulnificus]MDT8804197.1 pilin [Vibrio vulnificus]PUZ92051.1 prepilin-type cleavage/methylation domain-containing protein [Vibrio vulnificus]PWY36058.1 prepilin-type cleavage/methylation domain-containing protein [Vibrio vulnificus]BDP29466.1 pilus assembly protein PilA [Vibrio vulnificus]HAS8544638.1 pilin [Vibrio vulnificus]
MKKLNKTKKQQGFTLIELMIVVGIIGILSALAVPAYKSYVIKTEANTAVGIPRTLLSNIDLYIQEKGAFPETANIADVGGATDMSALGGLALTKDGTTATNGTLIFTISNGQASLNNKKITYTRTGGGWKCTHDIPTTLLTEELKSCKATTAQQQTPSS